MNEAVLLVRRALTASRNILRASRDQSRLKILFVTGFCICWLAVLFFLFRGFFLWLQNLAGAGIVLIPRLFTLFFMGIGGMLILSGAVTGYGALFQSRETRMLLSWPILPRRLMYYKFLESSVLSSWAFFLIMVPFIAAYAAFKGTGPMIAIWTISFSIPFVILCSGMGMLLMLLVVRFISRRCAFILLGIIALGIVFRMTVWPSAPSGILRASLPLADMIPGLRVANHPFSPSFWLSEGILAMSRGDYSRGGMFWIILTTTAGLFALLGGSLGRQLFLSIWYRSDKLGRFVKARRSVLFQGFFNILPLGRGDLRAFLEKDIRLFLREPSQWVQSLIFFGLLGFYFFNIRTFGYSSLAPVWRNLIGFLNVFSLAAVMSSLASRFSYPQMSLEGQGIWIVGLAPTSMARILYVKFSMATLTLMFMGGTLCIVSTYMLRLDPGIRILSIVMVFYLAMSLSALSVGLGAIFLETEIKPPSAIISGFGGTLNLILGLTVMIITILPVALTIRYTPQGGLDHRLVVLACWAALVTLVFTLVPLAIARHRLLHRDY